MRDFFEVYRDQLKVLGWGLLCWVLGGLMVLGIQMIHILTRFGLTHGFEVQPLWFRLGGSLGSGLIMTVLGLSLVLVVRLMIDVFGGEEEINRPFKWPEKERHGRIMGIDPKFGVDSSIYHKNVVSEMDEASVVDGSDVETRVVSGDGITHPGEFPLHSGGIDPGYINTGIVGGQYFAVVDGPKPPGWDDSYQIGWNDRVAGRQYEPPVGLQQGESYDRGWKDAGMR